MILFFVKYISKKGQIGYDFIQARSYKDLIKKLSNENSSPLDIKTLPAIVLKFIPKTANKISSDDILELMDSLHLVIKSGLPLYEGLRDLAKESNNKYYKNMLYDIADSVNNGQSLYTAFSHYKNVISDVILNLIKIGEDTGQLDITLDRAAYFLRRVTSLKKKAKSALIYPTFAFFAVFAAMLVWMIYVLPQMLDLFKNMDIKLPLLTVYIMKVSDFLSVYYPYIIFFIISFLIIFKIMHKKYRKVRYHADRLILKIPIIKQIVKGFNIAFISEYLRLALISGVPVYSAIETLASNLKNEVYKTAMQNAKKEISKGISISSAFSKTSAFTPFTVRMINVGESSGSLDTQLDTISNYYYEKVSYFAENIGKVIEPVVLIFVGGFMALVIAGLLGPMYDLISKIK